MSNGETLLAQTTAKLVTGDKCYISPKNTSSFVWIWTQLYIQISYFLNKQTNKKKLLKNQILCRRIGRKIRTPQNKKREIYNKIISIYEVWI